MVIIDFIVFKMLNMLNLKGMMMNESNLNDKKFEWVKWYKKKSGRDR